MSGPDRTVGLDVRVWLLWGLAVSIPLLTGRHPVIIAELTLIVLVVRSVCLAGTRRVGWGWLLRLSAVAVPLGALFNVLTVHAGNQQMIRMPGAVPIISGQLTWNALAYGVISGLTIVALVAAGITVAAALDWSELMRLLPARAASLAVAGSVAWAFLPQLAQSWRDIREAQTARGHRWRGVRDAVPLLVPLLAGGLDRSITMAEALESRGFGATASRSPVIGPATVALAGTLTLAVAGLYLFAVGQSAVAAVVLALAIALAAFAARFGAAPQLPQATRYRQRPWTMRDTVAASGAVLAMFATAVTLQVKPDALRYDPYPAVGWPVTTPLLIVALAALMLPAVVAPAMPVDDAEDAR